jgi:membrane complex biogenesis BtpA family protein
LTLTAWQQEFEHPWPLIGVVHLLPLPGSPLYGGRFSDVLERAVQDARTYREAGFDVVMVENFGDRPFFPDSVPAETVAALSVCAWEVQRLVGLPVGVNVLRNDARSAVAIASVTGARFIRVNVHIGAMVTDQGVLEGRAWETLRARRELGSEVFILADVAVKHAGPLVARAIEEEAREIVERGLADGIIVTGKATGLAAPEMEYRRVKEALKDIPVLAGSGVNPENLPVIFPWTDGAIVGTFAKRGGVVTEPVDPERARQLGELRDRLLRGEISKR